MIGLDRLIEQKGVIAAGQFSEDGKIIRKVGDLPEKLMEETARICAEQNRQAADLTKYFNAESELEWEPLVGWAVFGGNYGVVISGNTGVFMDMRKADVNQLMIDLREPTPTGPRPMNY